MAPNPKLNGTQLGLWCDRCFRPLYATVVIGLPKGVMHAPVRTAAIDALHAIARHEGWRIEGKEVHCPTCTPGSRR